MMTTCIPDDLADVTRRGSSKQVPLVIEIYNNKMGGVDKSDQMLTTYKIERRRLKEFLHLLNGSILNSYIIHKKLDGNLKRHVEFCKMLTEQIVEQYNEPKNVNRGGRPCHENNPIRLTARHFPSKVPGTAKKVNATRICAVCSKTKFNGKKVRKESRYECSICDVGLCVDPCFRIFHT